MNIAGRADVDKAVATVPDQLKKDSKEETQVSEKANNAGKKAESDKSAEEEEMDEDEEEVEIPAKKSKVEGKFECLIKKIDKFKLKLLCRTSSSTSENPKCSTDCREESRRGKGSSY